MSSITTLRLLYTTLLLVTLSGGYTTAAQSNPQVDENVILEISVAENQQSFCIGETIPLKLSFKSKVPNHYQINTAQYDRSGRMNYERFVVSPAEGAEDPLSTYTYSMRGITNYRYLKPEPWTITLNLNEWIRFMQPGEYRLTVFSTRVEVRSRENFFGSPVSARSNEIRLNIIAPSPEWQKQILDEAVKTLDGQNSSVFQTNDGVRRKAAETLRFLGTVDATKEMVKRFRDQGSDGLVYVYELGIISSPHREVARNAMESALADPDRPIDSLFLYTLRVLNSDPTLHGTDWKRGQQEALDKLLAVLPNKRGQALTISLSTTVNEGWNGQEIQKEVSDKLLSQLLSAFDQLSLNEQNVLLDERWEKIKSPALLPVLKRRAELFQEFPEMREGKAYDSLRLSASALRRWYELDPAGARPAIITEIMRPRPRYDARVLGMLPDATLPEVDLALAEHFTPAEGDAKDNLASLIGRYASEAILSQVVEELDRHVGKWACAIQEPLLAYVLRVNPAAAQPRIEKAVAVRGEEFNACNHSLFQRVAELHYDPVLEEIGMRSLDDPDPQVAMTAATMLGKYGSPATESGLWRRYESWCARWAGHESQLDVSFADGLSDRLYQRSLGESLMRALATGQSWLSDQTRLQRLTRLTTVPSLRKDLERYQKAWEEPVFTIELQKSSHSSWARVAQYEFTSIDAFKNKLSQFPPGSKFVLGKANALSTANESLIAEVRSFLKSQGMVIVEETR